MSQDEQAFLEWLQRRDPVHDAVPVGIGDDCAVIRVGNEDLLITTDVLLDGTHFDSRSHTPEQIGRKAMACSLSDLAAMAARPIGAVAAVGLTAGGGIGFAKRMVAGMTTIADRYDCPLVGGDTTSWPNPAAVCVTMLGRCPPPRRPIRRNGARPGDVVYVTGPLGGSLLGRHLSFEPRIELADRLAETCDLHAMIDISDGLALDLSRICQASGVGAVLDVSLLAAVVSNDARSLSSRDGVDALDHALHDGEDFELIAVMPGPVPNDEALSDVRPVGRITDAGLRLRHDDGAETPLESSGYEHPL